MFYVQNYHDKSTFLYLFIQVWIPGFQGSKWCWICNLFVCLFIMIFLQPCFSAQNNFIKLTLFVYISETQPQLMLTGPMGVFNNSGAAYSAGPIPGYHGYSMWRWKRRKKFQKIFRFVFSFFPFPTFVYFYVCPSSNFWMSRKFSW